MAKIYFRQCIKQSQIYEKGGAAIVKKKKIDRMDCLNIGFFIYILLLFLAVVFLTNLSPFQKGPVVLKMNYSSNEDEIKTKASITSNSFKSTRLPINKTTDTTEHSNNDKSYSRLIKADTKDIPINYTEINYPGMDIPIYTYIADDGTSQYRLYVERETNGTVYKGYISAKQAMDGLKIVYDYDIDSEFIDLRSEKYGIITPMDAPNDITGDLIKVFGYTGLYYIQNNDNKEYYIYGYYDNREPGFFIANSTGNMIPGTLPIDLFSKE